VSERDAVLRLFSFRPLGPPSVLDAVLRHDVVPDLLARPGLVAAHVGRRGPDRSDERLIATVWSSSKAMVTGLGNGPGERPDPASAEIVDGSIEVLALAASLTFDERQPAAILRLFRGEVRDGELEQYADDVRRGAIADGSTEAGPTALFMGLQRPRRFVTLSLWPDWQAIEASTGGSLQQPGVTRHPERLVSGAADHYELLPDARPQVIRPAVVA
jgi:hypothetical protein